MLRTGQLIRLGVILLVSGGAAACAGKVTWGEGIPLWPQGAAPLPLGVSVPTKPEVVTSEGRPSEGAANRWVEGTTQPTLSPHIARPARRSGAAMIVCPGGGYRGMAFDKEGENICEWLAQRGITAFTLKYRQGGGAHQHPVPLSDVQRAVRWVRSHAVEYCIEPNRIGVMGFSAGGHLASTIGTHFDEGDAAASDPIERQSSRPDFLALIYPVITMEKEFTHGGSLENLLGKTPDPQLVEELSNYKHVTDKTPPTFMVHAGDDKTVPVENSLRFYRALVAHKVPAELHLYERGGHGFGMLQRGLPADHWPEAFEAWLKSQKLIR